jgi:hypothetical protein
MMILQVAVQVDLNNFYGSQNVNPSVWLQEVEGNASDEYWCSTL